MGFKVKALKNGRWRDGALRVEHDVEPGTVVEFREASDASYFADGVVGEWHNERSDASPPKDDAKPKKAKKNRGYDDVQEAAEE